MTATQAAATEVLLCEDRGAVRLLTLNRPQRHNAFDSALTRALVEALAAAGKAPEIRAIVLTGAGKSFSAGADTGEFSALTPAAPEAVAARAELTSRLHAMIRDLPQPVIAAARGHALGGGAGLLSACDLVVASETLNLGYPEIGHGIVPAVVMSALVRQLGSKAAFELVALGKPIDAARALALGLVNRVVPDAQLLPAALEMAADLAKASPQAMAALKGLFYRAAELPFEAAMQAGREVSIAMRGFRKAP
ncbi:MAG: enoyl-CoA hydratase/isomerase family protein [Alphaproteobacteria bacterium]|nr:enoyl-CoA hydratase/isomerase family protein [Alphaproteobacteria bacterium]